VKILAPLLQAFFTDWLLNQRRVSPNTVVGYRDTFRLLIRFAHHHLRKEPSNLLLDDLDAAFVGIFLDHLEKERKNDVRTRNTRLAAIHSFFRYISTCEPAHADLIRRVLAIPQKRFERNLVRFLTSQEITALLAAPDQRTWLGRRDHALLLLAFQTGLRVSEITGLRWQDVVLENAANVRCYGKGRKERCIPLTRQTVKILRAWNKEQKGVPSDPLFPSSRGGKLSRDPVERLVTKYASLAAATCPSLNGKRVSPHVLRHTTAVHLLQAGVDRSIIALWLGHEQLETTQMYLDADLVMKEKAIARTAPLPTDVRRYRPHDSLLAFLQGL
jgi:integrase/recombinase XerD